MAVISEKLALPLYISVFLVYLWTAKGQSDFDKNMKKHLDELTMLKEMEGFGSFYFTTWTFVLQIVFVLTAIFNELSHLLSLPSTIQNRLSRTRAFIFHGLLLPTTMLVITTFWGLWHFDRSLIFPASLDKYFPVWLNHALHTFIAVPLVIELALPKRANFVETGRAKTVLLSYMTVYMLLFVSVYFRHGLWLYPVYKNMTWPQRSGFFIIQLFAVLVFQIIGITIHNSKRGVAIPPQKNK